MQERHGLTQTEVKAQGNTLLHCVLFLSSSETSRNLPSHEWEIKLKAVMHCYLT